ncbi:SDR family oxidoreductase [Pelagibacterium lentulum]|uniref:Dihydroflavonol-4-reductase n=1 Tax=Pelagibacterium lentulum TaxID=2029865 RepID=A0A916RGK8_9HYPH|nr:aldehyde reductase [Pelagibacterium lentulum]GGA55659.1 dihydroflavonol-4-reductase [Pelagibacterium lentulum]
MSDRVLLTGISGFLGGHVALALLKAGYTVRGSVRDLAKADKVKNTLARAGGDIDRLEFVVLDLMDDDGWTEAMKGVRYLQHTASPFVLSMPDDRNDLIRPAVEGTERALNAALAADVERIVLTSSMAAIAYGHPRNRSEIFTEHDWTQLDSGRPVNAYVESKTRAERHAWELVRKIGREKDLATINPGAILGPLLDDDPGTSATIVRRLLDKSVPAIPNLTFTIVDVRDVAEAHLLAMMESEAGGRRFPMGSRTMAYRDIADVLRERFPVHARNISRINMPDWAVRLYALFDRDVRSNLGELGNFKQLDSAPTEALLRRKLIDADDAIAATAQSLFDEGII